MRHSRIEITNGVKGLPARRFADAAFAADEYPSQGALLDHVSNRWLVLDRLAVICTHVRRATEIRAPRNLTRHLPSTSARQTQRPWELENRLHIIECRKNKMERVVVVHTRRKETIDVTDTYRCAANSARPTLTDASLASSSIPRSQESSYKHERNFIGPDGIEISRELLRTYHTGRTKKGASSLEGESLA